MPLFGFNRERASRLRKIADREGLSPPDNGGLRYPGGGPYQPGIPFVNASGETAPAYAVMKITDHFAATSTTPFGLEIGKPNTDFTALYLINGPDPVENGDIGTGFFHTGDGPEQYALYNNAATPLGGEMWSPVPNSWLLHRHGPGFGILGGPDGTKVNVIQIPPAEILVKRTAGSLAAGSSGEFEVWGGVPGSEADSGFRVTAFNKMSVAFGDEKFGAVGFLNGHAYAVRFQS